jgi:Flp pilus assembly protein TadD
VTKAPKNPLYRYHLAMALYQKGDKEQARQELQTALANGPSKEEAASIHELIGKI